MTRIEDVTSEHDVAQGCEALLQLTDEAAGLRAWIAIHDTRRGPAVGGIRRKRYASAEHAIADAAGLAAQMTLKTGFAGLPCGGGKSVILDHDGLDPERAYRALGDAIEGLQGRYFCGPDVGTGRAQLEWVRAGTSFVNHSDNDASEATARGVLAGIRATRRWAGLADGDTAFVQGVGRVGERVARGLSGWELVVCDPSEAAVARALEARPDARVVAPSAWAEVVSDLYSPCAVGPVVTHGTVGALRCRAICGSANTQLEDLAVADRLRERGVLYAPDFVVNAGAVIEGVLVLLMNGPGIRGEVAAAIDRIESRLEAVFEEAEQRGCSTLAAAMVMAA